MRLISSIHDYYDAMFAYGVGDKRVFNRETKDVSLVNKQDRFHRNFRADYKGIYYIFDFFVIGFCGEIYHGVQISSSKEYPYQPLKSGTYYTYDNMVKDFPEIELNKLEIRGRERGWVSLDSMKEWLGGKTKNSRNCFWYDLNKIKGYFKEYKVSYFVLKDVTQYGYDEFRMTLYPVLKDYNFGKVEDNFQCYTKIEWYMNNELILPDDPYVMPVSDKIKAESHGFDQFSFRTAKQK